MASSSHACVQAMANKIVQRGIPAAKVVETVRITHYGATLETSLHLESRRPMPQRQKDYDSAVHLPSTAAARDSVWNALLLRLARSVKRSFAQSRILNSLTLQQRAGDQGVQCGYDKFAVALVCSCYSLIFTRIMMSRMSLNLPAPQYNA